MNETHAVGSADRLRTGAVKADFPVLADDGPVYLDSGASAQTPRAVIDAVERFYARDYANIHRGVYPLSERATALYEGARETVRRLLNARRADEIVFLRGATEALNLLAHAFAEPRLGPGDEILVTHMEHHANIVPWQMLCERTGAKLVPAPILDDGSLDMAAFRECLNPRTRLVSVSHVSNVLGTINPVREIVELAHRRGLVVILDGAQAAPHMPVDVQDLDCDFYVFSGHKLYGPTGIGALYGRAELLESMLPYQGGGDMILSVSFDGTTYAPPPARFEAGTPHIAGAIGLAAAVEYLEEIGLDAIAAHEDALLDHGEAVLAGVPGLRRIGTAPERAAIFSFTLDGVHPHDIASFLASAGIAVRAGHHCAQPVMDRFGVPATIRASTGLYNTTADLDALVEALHDTRRFFGA